MGGKPRTVVLALLVLLTLSLPSPTAGADNRQRDHMFALTNQDRVDNGRDPLTLNEKLSQYAKSHSGDMAQAGYLFHTADLAAVLDGVKWSVAGENVGAGSTLPDVEKAFMDSKPHRRNILRRAYTHVAVGVVWADGTAWVTVIFYG